VTARCTLWE